MYVNIEFLDTEPIENVITALHHKIEKTIFIGYEDVRKEYGAQTESFLKNCCGVKDVKFKDVSKTSLQDVLKKLREVVKEEVDTGNKVFFDITGGEGLILVAFGMLAQEFSLPIHLYDVVSDTLLEMNPQDADAISTYGNDLQKEKVKLDLATFIRMQGAVISAKKVQGEFDTSAYGFKQKIEALWDVLCDYKDKWNFYAEVLGNNFKTDDLYADAVIDSNRVYDLNRFEDYLYAIAETKAISKLRITDLNAENGVERKSISFYYDSDEMKRCLIKGGNTLELHTYYKMEKESFDCRQSVMIDWDGVEHGALGVDVLNEIDVLCIEGNVPTFISCKGGRMDDGQALEPMYELLTVANRFGGKYAKKVLAIIHPLKQVYLDRAQEMGIEVRCYGK